MLPEIGHFALILALALAICQGVLPLVGAHRGDAELMAIARPAAIAQFSFVAFAFGCLTYAFLSDDFTVAYVANHSQLALPTVYKISAVWGAHEGSLLLWILMMAMWTVAVARYSRDLPEAFAVRVISVLGLLSVGFLLFTLLTSNPFDRLMPAPPDGADLNPLLQDPGLAIHPPILYLGYVGFSVAFSFAIAAMLSGNLDQNWARWTRPWTTWAWLFLTVGIALGSWWAYYELGWGGWWFWDPVENASFMPWLVGTALIHSLAVTEKRGLFKSWTLLLAISAFSLSLLGTFLVRSGILVSVHAFATDPARGLFILAFLGVVILGALILFALRAPQLDSQAGFRALSRDTFLLVNNVLLVIACTLVLYGTMYPLLSAELGLGQVSIGPPWFEIAFALPMLPLMFLIGFGMHSAWRQQDGNALLGRLKWIGLAALIVGVSIPTVIYGRFGALVAAGCVAAVWVMARIDSTDLALVPTREGGGVDHARGSRHVRRALRRRYVRSRGFGDVRVQHRNRPQHGARRGRRGGGLRIRTARLAQRAGPELPGDRGRSRHHQGRPFHRSAPAARTDVPGAAKPHDRSRHQGRSAPRPVHRLGRLTRQRCLERAVAIQTDDPVDLARLPHHGLGRHHRCERPALPVAGARTCKRPAACGTR